jgi:hypothetical protein
MLATKIVANHINAKDEGRWNPTIQQIGKDRTIGDSIYFQKEDLQ